MSITIERVIELEQCSECHHIAAQVWGEESACSIPQMMVHASYGGVLLLARRDGEPVGFVFSFPALYRGDWVLWSHETAIVPAYLHEGIGTRLKSEQRSVASSIGYKEIVWTFDPLISRNAHFNLNKLNAQITEYKVNAYGVMEDFINRSLETDRFIAVWSLSQSSVIYAKQCVNVSDGNFVLLDLDSRHEGLPPNPIVFEMRHPIDYLLIETRIPLDSQTIFRTHQKIGVQWRLAFRKAALQLIHEGYSVVSFQRRRSYGNYLWKLIK